MLKSKKKLLGLLVSAGLVVGSGLVATAPAFAVEAPDALSESIDRPATPAELAELEAASEAVVAQAPLPANRTVSGQSILPAEMSSAQKDAIKVSATWQWGVPLLLLSSGKRMISLV